MIWATRMDSLWLILSVHSSSVEPTTATCGFDRIFTFYGLRVLHSGSGQH